jgi:hypothetical protein
MSAHDFDQVLAAGQIHAIVTALWKEVVYGNHYYSMTSVG